jgi:hypothetical protein
MTIKKVLFDTNPDAKAKRYCEDPFEVRCEGTVTALQACGPFGGSVDLRCVGETVGWPAVIEKGPTEFADDQHIGVLRHALARFAAVRAHEREGVGPPHRRKPTGEGGSVTLPNRARNNSPGTSGSRRSDDFVPCLHGRCPEGSVRSC